MNRAGVFSFRVSKDERKIITDLAARLQRSQSDAVRFVIVEAVRKLEQAETHSVISIQAKGPEINFEVGQNVDL